MWAFFFFLSLTAAAAAAAASPSPDHLAPVWPMPRSITTGSRADALRFPFDPRSVRFVVATASASGGLGGAADVDVGNEDNGDQIDGAFTGVPRAAVVRAAARFRANVCNGTRGLAPPAQMAWVNLRGSTGSDDAARAWATPTRLSPELTRTRAAREGTMDSIAVTVSCTVARPAEPLALAVDESYTLSVPEEVDANSQHYTVRVTTATVWGLARALETLAQLVEHVPLVVPPARPVRDADGNVGALVIRGVPVTVDDAPAHPWRGVSIDTSRHFMPLPALEQVLEGMAQLKLNVLHLHLSDADSFPAAPATLADTLRDGGSTWSWTDPDDSAQYTTASLRAFVALAAELGIRVVPEFDLPGHSAALDPVAGTAPADCWPWARARFPGPPNWRQWQSMVLDPVASATADVFDAVLDFATATFDDPFLHLGNDEVSVPCLSNDTRIVAEAARRNVSIADLWGEFVAVATAAAVDRGRTPILWQEPFDRGFEIPRETVINAWKDWGDIGRATAAGHRSINSVGWYTDRQVPGCEDTNGYVVPFFFFFSFFLFFFFFL
jgi:hypothetical protein